MNNTEKIINLFTWMEKNLNHTSHFLESDIAYFFAENFIIKTNLRVIKASPSTYCDYLFKLKNTLKKVSYEIEDVYETKNVVTISFTINLDFLDKKPLSLIAISIFKLDPQQRILEWKEVFANKDHTEFEYDPKK